MTAPVYRVTPRAAAPVLTLPLRQCGGHGPSWRVLAVWDRVQFTSDAGPWVLLEAVKDLALLWVPAKHLRNLPR